VLYVDAQTPQPVNKFWRTNYFLFLLETETEAIFSAAISTVTKLT